MSDPFEEMNDRFREWYSEVEGSALAGCDPLLIVHSTPRGGSYSLRSEGRTETVEPVGRRFAQLRAIAHVPLAIYALHQLGSTEGATARERRAADMVSAIDRVVPELATWEDALALPARDVLTTCRGHLADLRGPADGGAEEGANAVANAAANAADEQLHALLAATRSSVDFLVAEAGRIQALDCSALLARWRAELGERRWVRLVAVVGTAPAQRGPGTHGTIVARALGAQADDHLVVVTGAQDDALLERRLGVVLANRGLASAWFGDARGLEADLMTAPVAAALEGVAQVE